jgi:hypothetical protein
MQHKPAVTPAIKVPVRRSGVATIIYPHHTAVAALFFIPKFI